MKTEDFALRNLSTWCIEPTSEERRTQREIDQIMRALAADRYNPTWRAPSPTVTVGTGTKATQSDGRLASDRREGEEPIEPPPPPPQESFADGVIRRMIDKALPHGPAWGAEKLASTVCASAVAPKHSAAEVVDRDGEGDSSDVALSVIPSESVVKRRKVR